MEVKETDVTNPTQDKNAPVITKEGKKEDVQLTINQIQIRAAVRTKKDIQDYLNAVISAESVYWPSHVRLYDLYTTHVINDGHLYGILSKRINAVLNKEVIYKDKAGKEVDGFSDLVKSMTFRNVMKHVMETQLWGRSGMEFYPGATFAFKEVERKHINTKHRVITLEQTQQTGIPYDDLTNVWILGESNDLGLLYICAPYAIYKRGNMADWANFIEIFGIPMRVIEYDANDEQTKIELKSILDESGNAMALMIPKQASFKTQDGKQTNGDGQLQERFINALNSEMSIVILGNTETTSQNAHSGGNNAKAKTHSQQQDEIHKSDIIYTSAALNDPKFIAILKSYGYPVVDGGKFEITEEIDIDYLVKLAELWNAMPEDLPISDDDWYTKFHIPKPKNYDELKKAILDKQKVEKEADSIGNDPKNKPSNKPGNKPQPKNQASVIRTIRTLLADFFDPAR